MLLKYYALLAFTRLVVIPGKGCGTLKPLRPLNGEDADKIMSPSEAECGTIRAEVAKMRHSL